MCMKKLTVSERDELRILRAREANTKRIAKKYRQTEKGKATAKAIRKRSQEFARIGKEVVAHGKRK